MPIFKRKIYDEMLRWKGCDGRQALLIEGARRVGKTTVVRQFAENEYGSHIYIDFSVPDDDIRRLIGEYGKGADRFFARLQEYTGTRLRVRDSVIIFDEVQMFPLARQLIKHLVADGRYDYIETGSLISIKRNVKDILIPSEERRIGMHPMDFEEFLWALGRGCDMDVIRDAFDSGTPLGSATHKRLMDLYTTYMMVGGMPQAVESFLRDNNFEAADEVKRSILEMYHADAVRINARRILHRTPAMLSRQDKTFSPSEISGNGRTRDYLDSVDWLSESRMVNVCHRCSDPGPAPGLTMDPMSFKIYLLDTGLLVTAALAENVCDREELYGALLKGRLNVNRGMFFENAVAQELTMTGHELIFAKFRTEDSNYEQEVDFLIARGNEVIPLESKSGGSSRHVSLDRFMSKYSDRVSRAYVIHSKDLRVDGDVTYIPIYMTMLL